MSATALLPSEPVHTLVRPEGMQEAWSTEASGMRSFILDHHMTMLHASSKPSCILDHPRAASLPQQEAAQAERAAGIARCCQHAASSRITPLSGR